MADVKASHIRHPQSAVRHLAMLSLLFLISGATTLILQVAWTKELSYLLGNTLYAVSTVVAAFMGGLGLGAWLAARWAPRWKRPLHAYSVMELIIAVFGAMSIPLLRNMESVFGWIYSALDPAAGAFLLIRFALVFITLAPAVTLMGMTLPVMTGTLGRREEGYERSAGWFYGMNTVGAMLGTFAAGFFLVPKFGLFGSCLIAAALDGIVALAAWQWGTRTGEVADIRKQTGDTSWTSGMWLIGIVYAVSGAIAMVYEVGWFRLLGLVLGPSVDTFAVVLAIYLAGLGLGSVAGSLWTKKVANSRDWFAAAQVSVGVLGLFGIVFGNDLPRAYFEAYIRTQQLFGDQGYIAAHALVAGTLVLLPTFMMGMMFPLGVRAFREAGEKRMASEQAVGRIYAMNTTGAIIGSLAAGFALIPAVGVRPTLILAAGSSAALGLILWMGGLAARRRRLVRIAACGAVALLIAGIIAKLPAYDAALLNQGTYREVRKLTHFDRNDIIDSEEESLLFYREGLNTTVAVFRLPGEANLRVTGKAEASTTSDDLYTQIFVGELPMLFAKEHRNAAVIGYGSGISAGSMLRHEGLESLDIIELEKAVLDSSIYFDFLSGAPLQDPRSRRILEDGRIHLTYTNKTYDVITSEPSNPWIAGVSNLFTVDFYERVRRRLSPQGIFGQWIQLYEMSEPTLQVMLASLHAVFPHVAIFLSPPLDMMVIASPEPLTIPWAELEQRFSTFAVRDDFRRVGILTPGQLMFYFLASEDAVNDYAAGAQALNTDNNVWLEHRMPLEFFRNHPPLDQALLQRFGTERLASLKRTVPDVPLASVLHDMVEYSYTPDFKISGDSFLEPVSGWRDPVLQSLGEELMRSGDKALLDDFHAYEAVERQRHEGSLRAMKQVLKLIRQPSRQALDEAIAADPNLPLLLLLRGNQAYEAHEYDIAEKFYAPLVDKPWTSPHYDALMAMSDIYEERGDRQRSLEFLERAMAYNPYYPMAFEQAAQRLIDEGRRDRASEIAARGLVFNPDSRELRQLR
jgi:spermidine synthase